MFNLTTLLLGLEPSEKFLVGGWWVVCKPILVLALAQISKFGWIGLASLGQAEQFLALALTVLVALVLSWGMVDWEVVDIHHHTGEGCLEYYRCFWFELVLVLTQGQAVQAHHDGGNDPHQHGQGGGLGHLYVL